MSEPWLNPECGKMLLYAYDKGHKISVYTTLTGMSPSDVDIIESIPIETFSIHLPSAEGSENIVVDYKYLTVLAKISTSKMNKEFHFHGKRLHTQVKPIIQDEVEHHWTTTRCGNQNSLERPSPPRKRGRIRCRRMDYSVLLPNGDVLVCCMDYGMQHVLGNLLSSDYKSLFESMEWERMHRGFGDESEDIICRFCDGYVENVDFPAKICNPIAYGLQMVRTTIGNINDFGDVARYTRKIVRRLKR
jgi:hypothetical protein